MRCILKLTRSNSAVGVIEIVNVDHVMRAWDEGGLMLHFMDGTKVKYNESVQWYWASIPIDRRAA